jgi:hypothetical protein
MVALERRRLGERWSASGAAACARGRSTGSRLSCEASLLPGARPSHAETAPWGTRFRRVEPTGGVRGDWGPARRPSGLALRQVPARSPLRGMPGRFPALAVVARRPPRRCCVLCKQCWRYETPCRVLAGLCPSCWPRAPCASDWRPLPGPTRRRPPTAATGRDTAASAPETRTTVRRVAWPPARRRT